MKKSTAALSVLMISFLVTACGGETSSEPRFTVGGFVSGLSGTLVLRNNGGGDLTVTANGSFAFSTAMAPGSSYAITVRANPARKTCIVSKGTGTVLISNVTTVAVDCFERGGLDVAFNAPTGFSVQNNAAGGDGSRHGQ